MSLVFICLLAEADCNIGYVLLLETLEYFDRPSKF